MRVAFLIHDVYGVGGTIRTVLNLAGALAERHDVELVSVYRRRYRPLFALPPRVRLTSLVDLRRGTRDRAQALAAGPSTLVPPCEQYYGRYSRLTDERIAGFLRHTRAELVVGTRPALNLLLARFAPAPVLTIAQEHSGYALLPAGLHAHLRADYHRLDAAVTVTEADAAAFRAGLLGPGRPDAGPSGARPRVLCIPNSVPAPLVPPSAGTSRIVMAAGRLVAIKRFDVLVHAFAAVVDRRPDWTLRIYGDGSLLAALRTLIEELDLHNHVFLMGRQSPLDPEWAKAAIAAASSDAEPFGMTLVEAMRCGLPVVSTGCDGPNEIIRPGQDGLLVAVGDPQALAAGLLELIDDASRRHRMAVAARENAQRFDPSRVAPAYERLFEELVAARGGRYHRSHRTVVAWATADRDRVRSALGARVPNRVRRWLGRPHRPGPPVDCWFDPAGPLVLALPPTLRRISGLGLVCRQRADAAEVAAEAAGTAPGAGAGVEVRYPLEWTVDRLGARRGAVVLDPTTLGEGRWDVYLENRLGIRHRVRAGLRDLRELADPVDAPLAGPVVRAVPYRTLRHYLAVRVWVRPTHAEVTGVWYGPGRLRVEGRMMGECPDGGPPLLSLSRDAGQPRVLTVPGTTDADGRFRFEAPIAPLVAGRLSERDEWNLAVTAGPDGAAVRLARLLDDVAEKRSVYVYPGLTVAEEGASELVEQWPDPRVTVTPHYTVDGQLSVTVRDVG